MSDLKKYQEVLAKKASLASAISGIQEAKTRLFEELEPAEAVAMKAELAGEPSAPGLAAALAEKKAEHQKLGLDLAEAQKRLRACIELLPELKGKAASELWDQARPAFGQKVRAFAAALRAAAEAEKELVKEYEKIRVEYSMLRLAVQLPISPWPPVMLPKSSYIHSERGWQKFIQRMKDNGIEIDRT